MRIHPEGRGSLALTAGFILVVLSALRLTDAADLWVAIAAGACAMLFVFMLQFFRNPHRDILADPSSLLAPADGKVVAIEETVETDFLKSECKVIAIFMGIFDVHANRAPADGEVVHRQYHKGRYLLAWNPKSSYLNERCSLATKNEHGVILTRQIAGGLARRIITYPNVGERIEQGSQIGFIKFGSRVDLFFPKTFEVEVTLGQRVVGGKTVLARIK